MNVAVAFVLLDPLKRRLDGWQGALEDLAETAPVHQESARDTRGTIVALVNAGANMRQLAGVKMRQAAS